MPRRRPLVPAERRPLPDELPSTSDPGVSASDRKVGGTSTAARNWRRNTSRATAALDDNRLRPTRKSTRRSVNRGKPSQGKERTAVAKSLTPTARNQRRAAR
jgi:hypothetical protein